MQSKPFFLQAITPVHPGTGQESASVIDLPVAREAATGFPVIPASSIKGVLRNGREDELANRMYGSRDNAGELTFTDARLLFLPVRSYAGTFALLTCPLVLQRWQRDAQALGVKTDLTEPKVPNQEQVYVSSDSQIVHEKKVILEDIDLSVAEQADDLAKALSQAVFGKEETYFLQRFALVSDDVFSYFCESGLEVIARVQLDPEQKTVKEGPWYEEAIPAEAVFSLFALAEKSDYFKEIGEKPYLQVGGNTGVGRGLLRLLGVNGHA